MYETGEDLARLQDLLDRSYARAGQHLRAITTPERRLTAGQVSAYLHGIKHIALATATADGRPRVGPVDGFFVRGRFHCGTSPTSMRVRLPTRVSSRMR